MGNVVRQEYRSEVFIERAMDLWGSAVFKLAFAQTASKADAEDIYQEVFIRLLKDKTSFNDAEHLKAWLLRVTINSCHDLLRCAGRKKVVSAEEIEEQMGKDDLVSQEAMYDLARALAALPEDMRTVVHLYYYEGYSTEEIAKIMDVAPSTVRSRM